jgi:hypothetical protein
MSKLIKYIEDKLSKDRVYPCSIAAIKRKINQIPKRYLSNIKSIRLCNSKKNKGLSVSFEDTGRIVIFAFPRSLITFPIKNKPSIHRLSKIDKEFLAWGARFEFHNGFWWRVWDADKIENYFLNHVLLHEIGHLYGDPRCATEIEREVYAEKFSEMLGAKYRPIH